MERISVAEIQRNLHKLDDLDIVEVVDKKRNRIKGYFLDKRYHDIVEELYRQNEQKIARKLKALEALGSYSLGGVDIAEVKAGMYSDE